MSVEYSYFQTHHARENVMFGWENLRIIFLRTSTQNVTCSGVRPWCGPSNSTDTEIVSSTWDAKAKRGQSEDLKKKKLVIM